MPRAMHGFVGIKDTLFVFGGMYFDRFFNEGEGINRALALLIQHLPSDPIVTIAVLLNDMYLFDVQKLEWKKINENDVLGTFPSARMGIGMVAIHQKFMMYGGFGAEGMSLLAFLSDQGRTLIPVLYFEFKKELK